MSPTGFAQKMVVAAKQAPLDDGIEPALFGTLVAEVGRQIRPPFASRNGATQVVRDLASMWPVLSAPLNGVPAVHIQRQGTRVGLVTHMRDQPFIVDSIRLALKRHGLGNDGAYNVVLHIGRDEEGRIVRIGHDQDPPESLVRFQLDHLAPDTEAALQDELQRALTLSRAMVQDFGQMVEAIEVAAARFSRLADRLPHRAADLEETGEMLRWLLSDNFVFMGVTMGEASLGFSRPELKELWDPSLGEDWSDAAGRFPVRVRKSLLASPVHRAGRLDELCIAIPSEGRGTGTELRVQGLFTYRAVTHHSRHVPLLRRLLAGILQADGAAPGSYRYKGIANVFDSLPIEFLFTAHPVQIDDVIDGVLESEQEQVVRARVVQSPSGRASFVIVAMPRDRWSEQLLSGIERFVVDATGAEHTDHGVFVGRYDTMLVHYFLTGTKTVGPEVQEALTDHVQSQTTPWTAQLVDALEHAHGAEGAEPLVIAYSDAFDEIYQRFVPPARAVRDIALLEQLEGADRVRVDVYRDHKGSVSVRLFESKDMLLSDILPVLDNFGLIVIDQFADEVRGTDRPKRTIDTFRLKGVWSLSDDEILARKYLLRGGLEAVFNGHMADDGLNRVLLRANLPWRAVDLIRAYFGYARQLGLPYSLARVTDILLAQPQLVEGLWRFFEARFDPDFTGSRKAATDSTKEAFLDRLRLLRDHDQDVTFRQLFNLLDSTLRTNFYRTDRQSHYISFKIDCSHVADMPSPRMVYEIYVHHREVEGVHLRGGKIARGGIRWSDRADFRREILDLVSTQMVKNVLIVPEGAKGGFFMKQAPPDYPSKRKRADELYQVFIRGLLDLTDNIVDGAVTPPARVTVHDGLDPYLVVAADKGTAHLSDTANSISEAYGFWLGDAFASGGSFGYDHKAVGITARGAWVTVRRHFREMGLDPETDEFTAVGIGDCGGDVFGNGVIEHSKMRLLAAFNHKHVFIDPNPDTEVAYAERKRQFEAVQGWEHYDTSKISQGGGIFSRREKSIPLSPEIQTLLGVLKDELPVDTVIRLILRLRVDLLWNGGIGTYFKASHESHKDAGDATNDNLRINADELRCRVVGEGGNLGFTQAGRIEFALMGGRLNTDAIDNSGGVDMSDHEVNLKILLAPMVRSGAMTLDARNTLLEELTTEVADQVLVNSDTHGRQLSMDEIRASRDPLYFSRTIDWVCRRSGVVRDELRLPSDDVLRRRAANRQGITRPELAVISAHVKMHVFKDLKEAGGEVIPDFDQKVMGYFPAEIQKRFADEIPTHMLHTSIGMTVATTEVVGLSGALFFPVVSELTSAPIARIARAWYQAIGIVHATRLVKKLTRGAGTQVGRYRARVVVTDALLGLVASWLMAGEPGPDNESPELIQATLKKVGKVSGVVHQSRIEALAGALVSRELPVGLAREVAQISELSVAREIALLHEEDRRLSHSVIKYLAIGESSRVLPAIKALESRQAAGGWDPVAIGILRHRYMVLLRDLVRVLDMGNELQLGVDRVALRLTRGVLKPLHKEMEHVLGGDQPDLAALLVAEQRVRAHIEALSGA